MSAFLPWAAWLRHAVGSLGLQPSEFWGLSVGEWRALTAPAAAPAEADAAGLKAELEDLIAAHPDRRPT